MKSCIRAAVLIGIAALASTAACAAPVQLSYYQDYTGLIAPLAGFVQFGADGSIVTPGVAKGGSTIATSQVAVGTTATLIAAARTGRAKIGVTVTTAVQCAFGPAGVTLSTGWPLAAVAYAADQWDTAAALYGVCASAATVAEREQY